MSACSGISYDTTSQTASQASVAPHWDLSAQQCLAENTDQQCVADKLGKDTLARVLAILCRNTDRYASSLDGLLDLDYFNLFAVEDAGCKTSVRICSLEHVLKIQIPHKSVS